MVLLLVGRVVVVVGSLPPRQGQIVVAGRWLYPPPHPLLGTRLRMRLLLLLQPQSGA